MRKLLIGGLAALTFGSTMAIAAEAAAQPYRGGHGYYGRGYDRGYYRGRRGGNDAAIIAGVAGLAVGAALAGSAQPRYYAPPPPPPRYGYGYGYGAPAYGYGYGYAPACRQISRWDPYWGRYVVTTRC